MKKHILFLFFQIKSTICALPRILLCTLILSGVVFAIGIFGNKMMSTDNRAINAKIDVVLDPNDVEVLVAYQLYANMDGITSVAECRPTYNIDTALNNLKNGNSAAVVVIPFGFVDGIMNGKNIPGRIILPPNAGIESMMFCSVIDAGVHSLAHVESAIYAVSDVIINNNMGKKLLEDATDYLNDVNVDYAMKRNRFYKNISLSSTGESSIASYYLASAVVLLMILCGLSITGIFSENPPVVLDAMKSNRISKGYIRFSEYFAAGLIFTVLFLLITIISGRIVDKNNFELTFGGIISFVLLAFSIVAFIMFICMITDSGLISTLLIFLLAIFMAYACGRILPSVFLPDKVAEIGNYLPMKYWCSLYESITAGKPDLLSLRNTMISGLIFCGSSIGITYLRGRKC